MFYFIPSWYSQNRDFYNPSLSWYWHNRQMKLDDTMTLCKLFYSAGKETTIFTLGYTPNLRYYLHEFDLYELPYISIFDSLQNIVDVEPKIINFQELKWPKEAEFIYTPFAVIVNQNTKLFAEVQFGNDGNLIWIDYFEEGIIAKRFIFDDRGFLSSVLYFNTDGVEIYQDFLSIDGIWQFRQYFSTELFEIEINPQLSHRFKHLRYRSLKELIEEFVSNYIIENFMEQDTVVLSYNDTHNDLIIRQLNHHDLIISFFSGRPVNVGTISDSILKRAQLFLTDTFESYQSLSSLYDIPVANIPPYDARLSLGKSQRIKELIIYLLVDNTDFEDISTIIDITFDMMEKNSNIELVIASYRLDEPFKTNLEALVQKKGLQWQMKNTSSTADTFEKYYEDEISNLGMSQQVTTPDEFDVRMNLKFFVDESQLLKQLEKVRLIVDLSRNPDLYTQTLGISAGIPQINIVETEYVETFKNGYIISGLNNLKDAYQYYLLDLKHWNQALVYAISKIGDYTSGTVVEKILLMMEEQNNGR